MRYHFYMNHPTIAILDFGSQYLQLIARRVRENQVHSLIFAPSVTPDALREHNVIGIILSGGPASTYEGEAPKPDPAIFELGVPILGICYGMQVACEGYGSRVEAAGARAKRGPGAAERALAVERLSSEQNSYVCKRLGRDCSPVCCSMGGGRRAPVDGVR